MKKKINCNSKSSTSKILTSRKQKFQPKITNIPNLPPLNFINTNKNFHKENIYFPYKLILKSLLKYLKNRLPEKLFEEIIDFIQRQIFKYNNINNQCSSNPKSDIFDNNYNYNDNSKISRKTNYTLTNCEYESYPNINMYLNNTIGATNQNTDIKKFHILGSTLRKKLEKNLKLSLDFNTERSKNINNTEPKFYFIPFKKNRTRKITSVSILLNSSKIQVPHFSERAFEKIKKITNLKSNYNLRKKKEYFSKEKDIIKKSNKPKSLSKKSRIDKIYTIQSKRFYKKLKK